MTKIIFAAFFILFSMNTFGAEKPPVLETASFASGCFWGAEEFFRKMDGVKETRVGYEGGTTTKNVTYDNVSSGKTGHAETVELKFDPKKISYEKLLISFFKFHDPTTLNQQGNDHGTQYRSAIFYHNDAQKKTAESIMKKAAIAWKAPIVTEIKPASTFYPAEEYHQKYLIKNPGGYDNHYVRKIEIK